GREAAVESIPLNFPAQPVRVTLDEWFDRDRSPKGGRRHTGADEVAWCDPDHCDGDAVQTNCFAEDRRICVEPPSPIVLADENGWIGRAVAGTHRIKSASFDCVNAE